MNDRIDNIEAYSQKVRNYFTSIIDGRLLSLNIDNLSDEELLNALPTGITDTSRSLCFANNTCSWFTIGESRKLEYVRPFKQMCLTFGEESIYINYSRFWLPLSFENNDNIFFRNLSEFNTIDGLQVDPESFFPNHLGKKLFFICGKKGTDQYGRKQNCLLFALNNVDPINIRKYITTSQLSTLREVINNPIEYSILPETTIVFEWNGQTKKNYHIVGHPIIYDLVNKIYSDEFAAAFNAKYQYILSKYEQMMSLSS